MGKPDKFILVIFGASGDLTKRKLIPSVLSLYLQDLIPENFAIVGLGRTYYTDETFREKLRADLSRFSPDKLSDRERLERFLGKIFYLPMNASVTGDYKQLKDKLFQLDKEVIVTTVEYLRKLKRASNKHSISVMACYRNDQLESIDRCAGVQLGFM